MTLTDEQWARIVALLPKVKKLKVDKGKAEKELKELKVKQTKEK